MSIKNLGSSAALLMWPRGIIQLSKIRQVVRHIADWASAERLPTRDEDSTATAGIRWTVWRWAFVFIGRGRWKERDRGFVVWGGTAPFGGQGSRLHEGDDLSALNLKPKEEFLPSVFAANFL